MNFLVVAVALGVSALAEGAPYPQELFSAPSRQIVTTTVPYVLKEYPTLRTSVARIIDNVNREVQQAAQDSPTEKQQSVLNSYEKKQVQQETQSASQIAQPVEQKNHFVPQGIPEGTPQHFVPQGIPEGTPQLFQPAQPTTPAAEQGVYYYTTQAVQQETYGGQKITPTPPSSDSVSQTTPVVQQPAQDQNVQQIVQPTKTAYTKTPSVQIIGQVGHQEQTVSQVDHVSQRTQEKRPPTETNQVVQGIQHIFLSQTGQQNVQPVPKDQPALSVQKIPEHIGHHTQQSTESYQTPSRVQQAQEIVQRVSQEQVSQNAYQPTKSTPTLSNDVQEGIQNRPVPQQVSPSIPSTTSTVQQSGISPQHVPQEQSTQVKEHVTYTIFATTPSVQEVGEGVKYTIQSQKEKIEEKQAVYQQSQNLQVPQSIQHITQAQTVQESSQQQVSQDVYQSSIQQVGQNIKHSTLDQNVQQKGEAYQNVYQPAVSVQKVDQAVQYITHADKQTVQQVPKESYQSTQRPHTVTQNVEQSVPNEPVESQIKHDPKVVYQVPTSALRIPQNQDVQHVTSESRQEIYYPSSIKQPIGQIIQHVEQRTQPVVYEQQLSQEIYQTTHSSQKPVQYAQHVFRSQPVQLKVQPLSHDIYHAPQGAHVEGYIPYNHNVQQDVQRTVFGLQQVPQSLPTVQQKVQQIPLNDYHPGKTSQAIQRVQHQSYIQQEESDTRSAVQQELQNYPVQPSEAVQRTEGLGTTASKVKFAIVQQESREGSESVHEIHDDPVDVSKVSIIGEEVSKKLQQAPQVIPGVPQVLQVISHGVKPIVHAALQASHGLQQGATTVHHEPGVPHNPEGAIVHKTLETAQIKQSASEDTYNGHRHQSDVSQFRTSVDAPDQTGILPSIPQKVTQNVPEAQQTAQTTRTVNQDIGQIPVAGNPITYSGEHFTQDVHHDIHRSQQVIPDHGEGQYAFESLRTAVHGSNPSSAAHSHFSTLHRSKPEVNAASQQLQQVLRQVQQVRQELEEKQEPQRTIQDHPSQQESPLQENRQLPHQQEAQRQQYQQYQTQIQQEYESLQNQRAQTVRPQFTRKPAQSASPAVNQNQIYDSTLQQSSHVEGSRVETPVEAINDEVFATPVPIVRYENSLSPDGSYQWSYEAGNGIRAQETGALRYRGDADKESYAVQGGYSYTGPDGVLYSVEYIADENGFQPQGRHLPTQPPIPDALRRAIDAHMAILATAQPQEEDGVALNEDQPQVQNALKPNRNYAQTPF